ncbi:MAG TPA: PQQ-dependent sugar dehydrogenase, partial [Thermodesulfobacteriota bacterium]
GNGDGAGGPGAPGTPGDVPVRLEAVASGLSFPLLLTAPPGDTSRLFIVEKGGTIRIVENGRLLPTPFLDISALVSKGGEQGLLGLAFHPDYRDNRRFFVNYTDTEGDTQVVRYEAFADRPNEADPASRTPILTVEQPFGNHNGGHLAFGPDGYLYIGLGDGGSGNDPHGHGQNPATLLGAMLRIDVDRADPARGTPYAVPPDNPFVGRTDAQPEIWAIGLRNPWRFSFDRATGDLYIGDVGQGAREEIDVAPGTAAGLNYGWAAMEGTLCRRTDGCGGRGYTLPVLEYQTHRDGTCSVTGGYVYRGSAIPDLQGTYFYADYCAGWVRSFRYVGGRAADPRVWPTLAPGGNVPSFGEDAQGELYVLSSNGTVYRIVPGS